MLNWLVQFVNTYVVPFVIHFVIAALVLFVGLKLVKLFITRLEKRKSFRKLDSNISTLVLHTLHIVLNALIIIIVIQILGVPSATIVAVIGSCGLAFGLALQGGLSNLAGGVMLMLFKPFHSGDYISTADSEGTVEEIGIFYTKLVTPDHRCVNIPNSVLSSNTVTNLSAKEIRGIDVNISVAYGTDIELVRRTLIACAESNPLVLLDPSPKVVVTEHADSCIKLMFRTFSESKDYFQVRTELNEASLTALADAGIEIPFPQIDVHMK